MTVRSVPVALLGAALWFVGTLAESSERPRPRPQGPGLAALCGAPGIIGEVAAPIRDVSGCGISRPIRVHSIAGVALDPPTVIGCSLARRIATWLDRAAKPAFAESGDRLVGIGVAAGYVCRTVNNAEQAKISEHGLGRAIDIARFRLAGGETVSVGDDWRSDGYRDQLRRVHTAACGPFSTTLGPGSDSHHHDHFHYDIARRRTPYCP